MTFFDFLKVLLVKSGSKDEWLEHPDFEKIFSPFMLARYLSMKPQLLQWSRAINHLNASKLDKRSIFLFAWDNIPKQANGYIPYIKKEKKK